MDKKSLGKTLSLSNKNEASVEKEEEPPGGSVDKISSLKNYLNLGQLDKKITVSAFASDQGIKVTLNNFSLSYNYPTFIWRNYPKKAKETLAQNIAFCSTFSLPYLIPKIKILNYQMPIPLVEPFMFKGFSLSLPSIALCQEKRKDGLIVQLLKRFFNTEYNFSNQKTVLPEIRDGSDKKVVIIPFSFGKDSLLTLALCRELGLQFHNVYIEEPIYQYESQIKQKLALQFAKEFGINVDFLKNNFGILRQSDGYIGWELQLTQYSLILLPYVYTYNAGFIVFANEQSCNDTIIDQEGFSCNPVYEQSRAWLLANSVLASLVGGNSLTVSSMIEPLYELAIVKILHHRYPALAKYQMSCDPEDKDREKIKGGRWCENCSKCARIYIFLLANGIDPKNVGFTNSLLSERHASLYSIFGISTKNFYGYDQSGAGKEEQLLAFYLAWKRGSKGALINRFVSLYANNIQKKEKKLRRKYFGVHSKTTVPSCYKTELLRIFHQELDPLTR